MTIGERLALFRFRHGLTQKEVAEAFDPGGGTDVSCISRWETGKVAPSRFTAEALEKFMAKADRKAGLAS